MRAGNIQYPSAAGGATQTVTLRPRSDCGDGPELFGQWHLSVGARAWIRMCSRCSTSIPLPNGFAAGDGLNTASYTWPAPDPASLNTYIARFDYLVSRSNWLFVRGNLQNDKQSGVPQFPGQPASFTTWDNSKGFVVGDTWNVSSNLVNNLHYGFTRQGNATRGIGQGQYANFYNISPLYAETRTTLVDVPVHNFTDDLTWIHKTHTIQFGANYRLIYNHRRSDALSYNYGYTNSYALADAGIAGTGQSLDPAAFGLPAVVPALQTRTTSPWETLRDFWTW